MSKEMMSMDNWEKVSLPQDVVLENEIKYLGDIEKYHSYVEDMNSDYFNSTTGYSERTIKNKYLKEQEYKRRVIEKEIQLQGVEPSVLAENKKIFNKFNRKTKKIQQQEKKHSNKKSRTKDKEINKYVVEEYIN